MPRRTAAWGIALFVLSLAILFAASMLAHFWIRTQHADATPIGSLKLPGLLWLSTVVIIAASFTVGRAVSAARREKQNKLRISLLETLVLALLFIALQTPALAQLLREHNANLVTGNRLYGVLFFLVLLHALHVIGGLINLIVVVIGAYHDQYDHENYIGVRNLAVYWHFLDLVWLVMFLSLWAVG